MKAQVSVLLLCLAAPAFGQRDFLTADEVDQVRLAQEPNARLKLYVSFAAQRLQLLQDLISKQKAGRSALIHETLEDFTKIIETIDIVADDALKRRLDIAEGIGAVASAEKEMLEALKKVEQDEPKDMARYRFVLTTAIETTEDSLEMSQQDLRERGAAVAAKEREERKELEALMTPEEVKARRETAKKTAEAEAKQKRKAPTLRRKGEVPPAK